MNESKEGGYQPSPEEIQKAEEVMTEEQKRESRRREWGLLNRERLEEGKEIGDPTNMVVDHFQSILDKIKAEGMEEDARQVERLISLFQNFSQNTKKEYEEKKSKGVNPLLLKEDKGLAIFYSGRGIDLVIEERGFDHRIGLRGPEDSGLKVTTSGPLGGMSENGWKIFYDSMGIDGNLMQVNKEAFDTNYKSAKDKHHFGMETEESTNIPGVKLRARSEGANLGREYHISYGENSVRMLFDNTFMNRMRDRGKEEK